MTMIDTPALPAKVATAQATFRTIMDAMARPGTLQRVRDVPSGAPAHLAPASAALMLALSDHETPVWLDAALATGETANWLRFHSGAPIVTDVTQGSFVLCTTPASVPSLNQLALGTSEYPDRSATLIVQVESLSEGRPVALRGPGIRGEATLRAAIAPDLVAMLQANHALFPRGIDTLLVADDAIIALPRSTRLTMQGDA